MPRALQILRCPATPLIAGTIFIGSVLTLPIRRHGGSAFGAALASALGTDRAIYCVFPYAQQWFEPGPDGFIAVTDAAGANSPTSILASVDTFKSGPSGFWAPTSWRNWIRVTNSSTSLTPAQAASLRAQFVDDLVASGDAMMARESPGIRTADVDRTTAVWSGLAHNAISLVSFIAMTASLPALPRWARERRRRRQGLCPTCSYDLTATPPGAPCPECGSPARNTGAPSL
jgi:hypothetical protein